MKNNKLKKRISVHQEKKPAHSTTSLKAIKKSIKKVTDKRDLKLLDTVGIAQSQKQKKKQRDKKEKKRLMKEEAGLEASEEAMIDATELIE
jgi:adenosyl cobinamide kinase/adenosyl cobinamide phosphate guanylyltransferase